MKISTFFMYHSVTPFWVWYYGYEKNFCRALKYRPRIYGKSSLKAGLILKEHFTDYKYNFETGKQLYLLAKVRGRNGYR